VTQQSATVAGPPQAARSDPTAGLANILDQVATLAKSYDRSDLVDHLGAAKRRLEEPAVRVLVVGEYKKGKSSLVNGVLAVPVAPVDDDIATSVPTVVRYGEKARAQLVREPDAGDGEPTLEDVPVKDLPSYVCEAGNPGNHKRIRMVEVWLPRQILQRGLVLVDTPGVGGLGSVHTAATLATLPTADAVIFASDASQELTAAEVEFLRVAERSCPNIICVLTKIDLYQEYKRILEINEGHLRAAGINAKIIPISTVLRNVALKSENKDINAESGYPDLMAYLRDNVLGRAGELSKRNTLHTAIRSVEEMERPFAAERQVLADPLRTQELQQKLQEAKDKADELRSRSARWQFTLNDAFGDLNAEVDHDLRNRMRQVTALAEEAIDQSDPAHSWEEFRTWLNERVTYEVVQNYSLIADNAKDVAEQVAEHFEGEENEVLGAISIDAPRETVAQITAGELEQIGGKITTLGFQAIRQAYSNVSMFSTFGNMAHIALGMTNPVTLVIGLLSGGLAVHSARQRELQARRQQAKMNVRRYIDDVNFQVGKDFRDTIRHLQKELRDHFATRAEEVQRSTQAALQAVQQSAQQDQQQRQQRLQVVDAEVKRLAGVKQKLQGMLPTTPQRSGGAK
jgi:hypothetical protein